MLQYAVIKLYLLFHSMFSFLFEHFCFSFLCKFIFIFIALFLNIGCGICMSECECGFTCLWGWRPVFSSIVFTLFLWQGLSLNLEPTILSRLAVQWILWIHMHPAPFLRLQMYVTSGFTWDLGIGNRTLILAKPVVYWLNHLPRFQSWFSNWHTIIM